MAGIDKDKERRIRIETDPRFEPARIQLKKDRPGDWLGVLTLLVNGLESYKAKKDMAVWDEIERISGLEEYLTKPLPNLPMDSHREVQSIMSFLRNSLTDQDEREQELSKLKTYTSEDS